MNYFYLSSEGVGKPLSTVTQLLSISIYIFIVMLSVYLNPELKRQDSKGLML